VLPGGRRHGHFPQMWQFKKNDSRGKFVAVSGRKVAVKGPKRLKCGRRKIFSKSLVKMIENMRKTLPDVHHRGRFPLMLPVFKTKMTIKVAVRALSETLGFSKYHTFNVPLMKINMQDLMNKIF
jgi:hypothetical protein